MLVRINDVTRHLQQLDPDTLAVTNIGPLGVDSLFGDCAFNAGDGTLYMVDGRGVGGLYRINVATGAATLAPPPPRRSALTRRVVARVVQNPRA